MEPAVVVEIGKEYLLALHVGSLHRFIGAVDYYFQLVILAVELEVFYNPVVWYLVRKVEISAAEERFVFTQPDKALDHVYSVVELSGIYLVPRHTAAAVGVASAVHAYLRAVINAGASGHGEKNGELLIDEVYVAVIAAEHPVGVVRIEQVEENVVRVLHIHCIAAVHHIFKVALLAGTVYPEIGYAVRKRIIHDRVEFVAAQPRHCVVPYFAQNVEFGVDFFEGITQRLAELMGDFVGNVKAYAVNVIIP